MKNTEKHCELQVKKFIATYNYKNKKIKVVFSSPTLEELYFKICEHYNNTEIEPLSIELPSTLNISYNPYVFHACYGHGRITEKKMIELLSSNIN